MFEYEYEYEYQYQYQYEYRGRPLKKTLKTDYINSVTKFTKLYRRHYCYHQDHQINRICSTEWMSICESLCFIKLDGWNTKLSNLSFLCKVRKVSTGEIKVSKLQGELTARPTAAFRKTNNHLEIVSNVSVDNFQL